MGAGEHVIVYEISLIATFDVVMMKYLNSNTSHSSTLVLFLQPKKSYGFIAAKQHREAFLID